MINYYKYKMEIAELRNEITNSIIRIPKFIDTTSSLDHGVWNNMRFISEILLQMISDKILKENTINIIIQQFEEELDMIMDVSDKIDNILNYYYKLLEYMLEKCIEEERYEAATNIRNFNDQYKNRYQF